MKKGLITWLLTAAMIAGSLMPAEPIMAAANDVPADVSVESVEDAGDETAGLPAGVNEVFDDETDAFDAADPADETADGYALEDIDDDEADDDTYADGYSEPVTDEDEAIADIPEIEDELLVEEDELTDEAGTAGEDEALGTGGIDIDYAHFPDMWFMFYIHDTYDKDGDWVLSNAERNGVTEFKLEGNLSSPDRVFTSVEGIRYFPNITSIALYNTLVQYVDLTANTELKYVSIYSPGKNLGEFKDSNSLKSLDLSKCTKLVHLYVQNNTKLTNLKLPKTAPNLDLLDLDHTGLSSFTGYKDYPSLRDLYISGVGLNTLDVRSLYKLENLHCDNNNLTSLNVSSNTKLKILQCNDNRLTEVNLQKNEALEKYNVRNNQLSKLDITHNSELRELDIRNNCLFYADLTNQSKLKPENFKRDGVGVGSTGCYYTLHVTKGQKTVDLSKINQCAFAFNRSRVNGVKNGATIDANGILTIPDDLKTTILSYRCREASGSTPEIDAEFYIRYELDKQIVPISSSTSLWFKNANLCVPGAYAVDGSELAPKLSPSDFAPYHIEWSAGEWIDTDSRKAMSEGDQFVYWGHYLFAVVIQPQDGYCFDKNNLPPAANFKFYNGETCIMKGIYSCLDGKGNLHVYAQSIDKFRCFTTGTKSYTAIDGHSITVPELCSLGVTSTEKDGKAVINVSNFAMSYLSENSEFLPTYWVKVSETDTALASKHNKWVEMTDSPMEFTDFSHGDHMVYMYAGSTAPTSGSTAFYEKSVNVKGYWTVKYEYAGLGSIAYGSLGKYNYSERIPADSIAPEPDPAKIVDTGWTVKGWYLDSAFTKQYKFNTKLTADNTTLYAKVEEKPSVTITFDRNGKDASNIIGWPGNQRAYIGYQPKKPADPTTVVDDPDVFAGWFTDSDCLKPFSFDSYLYENVTVYAKWINPTEGTWHTVKFEIPNEKYPAYSSLQYVTVSTQHVTDGEYAAVPDGDFDYKDRYGNLLIFKQWRVHEPTEQNGQIFSFSEPVKGNYVLHPEYVDMTASTDFYAYFDSSDEMDEEVFTFNEDKKRYEHVYSASAYRPPVKVYSAGQELIPGEDYKIEYSNNTNVSKKGKPATVTITGKGRYKGKRTLTFYILPVNLADKYEPDYFITPYPEDTFGFRCVRIPEICVQSGSKINPKIYYGDKVLGSKDYRLSNTGKVKADTSVTIWGKGNFTGMISNVPVKVLSKSDMKAKTFKVTVSAKRTYQAENQCLNVTTSETEPGELTVRNANGDLLKEYDFNNATGDFTVTYDSNYDAGTARVIVSPAEGSGYIGSVIKTFQIKPRSKAKLEAEAKEILSGNDITFDFETGAVLPSESNFMVSDNDIGALQFGSDYKVKFTNNRKAGTGKYKVTFSNNYKGHKPLTGTFTIKPDHLASIEAQSADMIYTKKNKYQSAPYVTYKGSYLQGISVSNKDYTVKYYTEIAGVETDITGKKIELAADEQFKRIKVVVTGRRNFTSDVTATTYYCVRRAPKDKINLSRARIVRKGTGKKLGSQTYTGRMIMPKVDVQIKKGKKWVTVDPSNYTVTYANCLSKGKATIFITGKNDAVGSSKTTFKIVARSFKSFLLNPGR